MFLSFHTLCPTTFPNQSWRDVKTGLDIIEKYSFFWKIGGRRTLPSLPNITLTDFAIDFHRLTSLQIKVVWTLIQCVSSNFAKTCCHQSFHQEKNITTKHHQHSPSINSLMTTTLMTTTLLLAYYDKQRGYRDPWSVFAKNASTPDRKEDRKKQWYIH